MTGGTMEKDFPFDGKYTFVDVEIPNLNNNCICAISMIVVEDHQEVLRHTELIDPRTFFSACNIKIHGIHKSDVAGKRTIAQFWRDYSQYFGEDYIIGAHNTLSDVSVLNKDLARIGERIKAKRFIDTMDLMSDFYFKGTQQKGDLKLNNIASRLGIYLDHHNPESDVNACYEVVRFLYKIHDLDIEPFIRQMPQPKIKSIRQIQKPTSSSMRRYLSTVRRQIALKDPATQISRIQAENRGEKAYRAFDFENAIFFNELAMAKLTRNPAVYLHLADIYTSLNMYHEAVRALEQGIVRLRKTGGNHYVLSRALTRLKNKREAEMHLRDELAHQQAHESGEHAKENEHEPEVCAEKMEEQHPHLNVDDQREPDAAHDEPASHKPDAAKKKKRKKVVRRSATQKKGASGNAEHKNPTEKNPVVNER